MEVEANSMKLQVKGPSSLLNSSFVPSGVCIRWGKKGRSEQGSSWSRIDVGLFWKELTTGKVWHSLG